MSEEPKERWGWGGGFVCGFVLLIGRCQRATCTLGLSDLTLGLPIQYHTEIRNVSNS